MKALRRRKTKPYGAKKHGCNNERNSNGRSDGEAESPETESPSTGKGTGRRLNLKIEFGFMKNTTPDPNLLRAKARAKHSSQLVDASPSKYKNKKTVVDNITFASTGGLLLLRKRQRGRGRFQRKSDEGVPDKTKVDESIFCD